MCREKQEKFPAQCIFLCLHRLSDFPAPGSVFFLLFCKAFCGLHYHLLNTLQLAIYFSLRLPDLCCFLSTSRNFSNKSPRGIDTLFRLPFIVLPNPIKSGGRLSPEEALLQNACLSWSTTEGGRCFKGRLPPVENWNLGNLIKRKSACVS